MEIIIVGVDEGERKALTEPDGSNIKKTAALVLYIVGEEKKSRRIVTKNSCDPGSHYSC